MFACRFSGLISLIATSLLVACGGGSSGDGPCETDPIPAACGMACDAGNACPAGYFCGSDGTCTAECTPGGGECGDSEGCSNSGECVPSGSDGNDGANDGGGDSDCPAVQVDLAPVVPVVTLLIDQSGSMDEPFGGTDRWTSLKNALIGTADDGVLFQLQASLTMGATLYTFDSDVGGTCPGLQVVAPAINNAQAIATLLEDNEPGDDTPTSEAVAAVTASFPASDSPRVLVLATDGNPDTCDNPDSNGDLLPQTLSEEAVQAAFDAGITTYVLSVGEETAADHLKHLANAGQGNPDLQNGPAEAFQALDPEALVTAFEDIGAIIRSCDIDIDGTVDLDKASEGTVTLNGTDLDYGDDWTMLDPDTLQLVGDACETFKSADSVSLEGEFPCGGVVVD